MPITKHSGHYCTYKTITGQSRSFLRLENSFGTVWSLSFAYVHMDEVYPETFGYVCAERKTCLQVPRNKQTKVYCIYVQYTGFSLSIYIQILVLAEWMVNSPPGDPVASSSRRNLFHSQTKFNCLAREVYCIYTSIYCMYCIF